MSGLKVLCIIGSVRTGRMADKVVRLVENQFTKAFGSKGHEIKVLDPEDFNLPLLKQPLHFYPDQEKAPEALHVLNKLVKDADAYLVVTPEYNRTMAPALTNTLNHLPPPSFEFKPSGLLSYSMGPNGGALACVSARPFLSEIGCIPVKHFVTIGNVHKEVSDLGETENQFILKDLKKLFDELDWWGRAAKNLRESEGTPKK